MHAQRLDLFPFRRLKNVRLRDFQISAVLFPFHANPQIFIKRAKPLLTCKSRPFRSGFGLSKKPVGKPPPNRARRRVRRARFFRSTSEGKTIPPVRKSPGKSRDFQISAGFLPFHENPQIFMERIKILFDTQGRVGNSDARLFLFASIQSNPKITFPENTRWTSAHTKFRTHRP